jgi:hypothetical protein
MALREIERGFVAGGMSLVLSGNWHGFTDGLQAIARAALEETK